MKTMETKTKHIEAHLNRYGSITSWIAFEKYQVTRLSSIIHRFRQRGMVINSLPVEDNKYVKYILISQNGAI